METSWRILEAESVLLAGQDRAEGNSTIQMRSFWGEKKKMQNSRHCYEEKTVSKTVAVMACNKEEHSQDLRVTKP